MRIACCAAEDISLGFGYVIAYLKEQGHDVHLFFDPMQYKRGYVRLPFLAWLLNTQGYLLKQIKKFKPDACLFSCVSATYQWGKDFAIKVRKDLGCRIIFGGVHATIVPEQVRKDLPFAEVVEGDGISYFGGEFEPDRLWPDREIFLKELPPLHRRYQLFMTSFGCPFNCTFCLNEQLSKIKQKRIFRRAPDACIRELQALKNRGARYILFVDDIFTCDKRFLDEFLPAYKEIINLPFQCFGHPKYLTEDIIKALKEAGCKWLWIGIQSGDERLRKTICGRPETNAEIIKACELIKKYKIKLMVDHIFGLPSENSMSQDISSDLYEKIKADIVNVYELVYFPKAEIIKHAMNMMMLSAKDLENINAGLGLTYQLGNKQSTYFKEYAQHMAAIPIGGISAELLPMPLIKLLVYAKANRWLPLWVILQNEIWFTLKALKRKMEL